jgi:hypothetical protein
MLHADDRKLIIKPSGTSMITWSYRKISSFNWLFRPGTCSSHIWYSSPYPKMDVKELEDVQRRTARQILSLSLKGLDFEKKPTAYEASHSGTQKKTFKTK